MRILGIDPGSGATGFGVVDRLGDRLVHVAHGTLRPARSASLAGRLHRLHRDLCAVIEQHAPDVAAVEQVFVAHSPRAALVLGHARGAALAALGSAELGITEYAASHVKRAVTGSGRADKRQVQLMVSRLLALDSPPAHDASDALAAAICHAHAGRLAALAGGRSVRPRSRRGARLVVRRVP